MTTTLQGRESSGVDVERLLELEHVDIHKALGIPPIPPAEEAARVRPWWRFLAVGLVSLLVGLIVGFGIAWWMRSDEVANLENQAAVMNSVPFGGFKSVYSAPREHLALAHAMTPAGAPAYGRTYSAPREHLTQAQAMATGAGQTYGSAYSAPREHLALADTLAAGGAQGSWQTASNGTRTFLYYPSTQASSVERPLYGHFR